MIDALRRIGVGMATAMLLLASPSVTVQDGAPTSLAPTTTTAVPTTVPEVPPHPGVDGSCGQSASGAAIPDAQLLAVLPGCRLIAYYGDPRTSALGILGRASLADTVKRLRVQTAQWQWADRDTRAICTFHLIVVSAQAAPGPRGLYRAQMPLAYVQQMADLTQRQGCLLVIDLQIGLSSVAAELPRLVPVLRRPHVHLALDPEWSMPPGTRPGTTIGRMDAASINVAVNTLDRLVGDARDAGADIPPKLLIVHRFTSEMVTSPERIRRDSDVQFVINMDGFGSPDHKRATYRVARQGLGDAFTGFKLFTKIDTPMLGPEGVLQLDPRPSFINYQ